MKTKQKSSGVGGLGGAGESGRPGEYGGLGGGASSPELSRLLHRCRDVYAGRPDWAGRDGIRTVNFARTVCGEMARLATLGIKMSVRPAAGAVAGAGRGAGAGAVSGAGTGAGAGAVSGTRAGTGAAASTGASAGTGAGAGASAGFASASASAASAASAARASWLNAALAGAAPGLRAAVEYACAFGTVVLKPNLSGISPPGGGVDVVLPASFAVTAADGPAGGRRITGIAFLDRRRGADGKLYTRIEHHRERGGAWRVSNIVLCGDRRVPITASPFAGLCRDITLDGARRPLFSVLRTPGANNVDVLSPLGLPVFADALEELADLDVAYSRFAREVYDSRRLVLLDSDRLFPTTARGRGAMLEAMGLPDYVKTVFGTGSDDVYHEIDPSLHASERASGIELLLDMIARKCGFSGGYFSRDGSRGLLTATQVEADDRRTVATVRDVRARLEACIGGLVDALGEAADLLGVPRGETELLCDFGDVTYNRDEDRARWYGYVRDGYVSFEEYMRRFEGEVTS